MLVVAVISVDAKPFSGFLVTLCYLIVRRLNLEVATKMLLHQQIEILG